MSIPTIRHGASILRALALVSIMASGVACWDDEPPEYDLTDPYAAHALPSSVEELSGLVILQSKYVAGVSDETGAFYIIDFVEGEVVREQPFAEPADFEDVVRIGATLYVLENSGTIYEIPDVRGRAPEPELHETGLQGAEGLAYDRTGNRLLIGAAGLDDTGEEVGAIYAFDLRSQTLEQDPIYTIPMEAVRTALDTVQVEGLDRPVFQPNALALRPGTRDLYVLSAKTSALLVLSEDGSIRHAYPLSLELFPEPEGITFLSGGDIVIGNEEGHGRPATILWFRPVRPF